MAFYARDTAGLVLQLQSELNRDDFENEFLSLIDSAIQRQNHEWFYFNQATSATVTTTQSQETDDATDLHSVFRVILTTTSGARLSLEKVSNAEIDAISVSTSHEGQPYKWAIFNGNDIRWYPIPDRAYDIAIKGTVALDPLATVGVATNVWLTDPLAYDYLRHFCRREFYLNINKDAERAGTANQQMMECLSMLRTETSRKEGSGKIRGPKGGF